MSVIYKFLFPSKPDGTAMSLLILALRILFGILLMSHGVQKWANYDVMSGSFPDPLGIGSQLSLVLAILVNGLFDGFHFRIPLSLGNASDDLHHVYRILCCSWF